ncbi:MAG: LamG-like jellyroll fold domain-containing protein, partial [Nitrososphaerales archaeon]
MTANTTISSILLLLILVTAVIASALNTEVDATNDINGNRYQYLFACTQYVPMFHCDYALNEFESSVFRAEFTNVLSPSREPKFVNTEGGKALEIRANALESINVKNSDVFRSEKFSLYVLFRPDNFENIFGDIVSYTNGGDNAGWELYQLSNDDPSTRKVGFTVYNTDGERISPEVLIIPNEFTEIVASFDGEKVKLFKDGNLHSEADFVGEFNSDLGSPISPVFAGGSYCSCNTASVTIDEIKYYDYAIPDDQIKTIHSGVNDGL